MSDLVGNDPRLSQHFAAIDIDSHRYEGGLSVDIEQVAFRVTRIGERASNQVLLCRVADRRQIDTTAGVARHFR